MHFAIQPGGFAVNSIDPGEGKKKKSKATHSGNTSHGIHLRKHFKKATKPT
jgi:hypothetical protein